MDRNNFPKLFPTEYINPDYIWDSYITILITMHIYCFSLFCSYLFNEDLLSANSYNLLYPTSCV